MHCAFVNNVNTPICLSRLLGDMKRNMCRNVSTIKKKYKRIRKRKEYISLFVFLLFFPSISKCGEERGMGVFTMTTIYNIQVHCGLYVYIL